MQLLEDILYYLALDLLWPQPGLLVSLTFLLTIDLVKCTRFESCPVTNRKRFIQVDCDDITEEDIKYFNKIKSRGGILSTLDNDSTRVSYIIDQILRNMHKVIKQPQMLQQYLYGMKWEAVVDAKLKLRARSIGSMRKIIIQQDFLRRPQMDGKIAFVIGRMVADDFGKYNSEVLANFILCSYIMWMIVVYIVIKPPHLLLILAFLLGPFCFLAKLLQMTNYRTKMEADYIGMLLSASAGYDPREAPQALMDRDIEYLNRRKSLQSRFFFPTSSERSRSLLESRAIEEALALYDDIKEKH